jgi:hypothetical protein
MWVRTMSRRVEWMRDSRWRSLGPVKVNIRGGMLES